MRFPLPLTAKIAGYIIGRKLRGVDKFATVLQLEPLHTCNLTCTGCGRIREYSTSLKDVMSLEDCLGAAEECEAPMISICGGEPLIYPHIEKLVEGLLEQDALFTSAQTASSCAKRCASGSPTSTRGTRTLWRFSSRSSRARISSPRLMPRRCAIRRNPPTSHVIRPSGWMYWNVHLDGLERTHDLIVEREGVFKECIAAIRMAKILGYQVATNTTIYKETDMAEIEQMYDYLSWLGVDGHTISPGYDYDSAKEDMRKRLNLEPENFFLTRAATKEKFKDIRSWGEKYTLFGTPIYFDFLAGMRDLTCSAWAIPTRNIRGWKAPCYLMTDGHYTSYKELLTKTDWEKYGVVDGVARDKRARTAWCIAATSPAPPSASAPSPATRGRTSSLTSEPSRPAAWRVQASKPLMASPQATDTKPAARRKKPRPQHDPTRPPRVPLRIS